MKRPTTRHRWLRPLIEELERRLLLSADVESVLLDPSLGHPESPRDPAAELGLLQDDSATGEIASIVRREVVFVDSGVEGHEQLVKDLSSREPEGRSLEVVLLDPGRDGVEQITETLARSQDLDAVHIVSHGSEGAVQLGSVSLSAGTLAAHADLMASWGNALASDADILFYGCDLAGGESGAAFVDSLAQLTGADVAASVDLTGSALLGGDWDLEYHSGAIETGLAFGAEVQQRWTATLAAPVSVLDDWTAGLTHDVSAGTDRLLIFSVSAEDGASPIGSITGVTWGGQALTKLTHAVETNALAEDRIEVWYLDEAGISAATGNTFAITGWSGIDPTSELYDALTLQNVDQANPFGDVATGNTLVSSTVQPDSALEVFTGDFVFYTVVSGGLDPAGESTGVTHEPAAGYTEAHEQNDLAIGHVLSHGTKQILAYGTEQPTTSFTGGDQNRLAMINATVRRAGRPLAADQDFSVDENAANGTVVGTVVASDPDVGDTLSYSITAGNTGGAFAIDPLTGQITVADGSLLDYETNPSFSLTVQVQDDSADGLIDTATVTIDLNDVNDPPTVDDQSFAVGENSALGTVVGTVTASDQDTGQSLSYAITAGNTGGAFAIDSATGEITVATPAMLDFETTPTFNLTVEVTDNGTPILSDTATVTINVADVNEAPLADAGPDQTVPGGAFVTLDGTTSSDPEGGALTYSWLQTAGTVVALSDPSAASPTFTAPIPPVDETLTFELTVTDPGLGYETELSTHGPISYWKLDEGAGLTAADQTGLNSGTYTNGVTLGGTGIPDGGSAATFDGINDYVSIAHNDAYLINEGTIQLWFKADNPVADQALFEKNVLGGGTGGHTKIYLDASGHITAFLEENIDGSNGTVYTIDGGLVSADEWHHVAFTFGSGGMQLYLDGALVGTNPYTGGLGDNSGPGPGNFEDIRLGAYNQDTGYFQGQIDEVAIIGTALELADIQSLYGSGRNSGASSIATVDIIVDVNVAPTISLPGGPLNFSEGDGPTVIDAAATVSDVDSPDFDGGALTVEFTANATANDRLAIDSNGGTGNISITGSNVRYNFGAGPVTIGTFSGGTDGFTPLTVNLNANADQIAVEALLRNITYENVSATPSTLSRTVQFVLTDGDGGTSNAETETINVSPTNTAPDLTVANPNLSYAENDAPLAIDASLTLTDPDDTDLVGATVSIAAGFAVGEDELLFTDQLGITGSFDPATGVLTLTGTSAVANYETALRSVTYRNTSDAPDTTQRTITMVVDDGFDTSSDSRNINVTAVNDAPALGDGTLAAVLEDTANPPGQTVATIFSGQFSDVDAGSSLAGVAVVGNSADAVNEGVWQYSTNAGANWFDIGAVGDNATALAIDAATLIRFVPVADFDSSPTALVVRGLDDSYGGAFSTTAGSEIRVDVDTTTNGGTTAIAGATADISTSITPQNDAPVVDDQTLGPVDENAPNGTIVGSVVASDPDASDSLTYSITAGNTNGAFAINATTGQITVANPAALDFETTPSFALTVQVEDTGTLTDTATVTIDLNDLDDLNDAPVVNDQTLGPVDENAPLGTVVGTVTASDADAGQSLSYAITGGNTGSAFAIDASTGVITVATPAALNFETAPTFTLTVQVTDDGTPSLSDTATVTIDVNDLDEAPLLADAVFAVDENAANGTAVGSVPVAEPDANDTYSYAITAGDPGGAFAIDNAGNLAVADGSQLDFEAQNSYTLSVRVSDDDGSTDVATITIGVNRRTKSRTAPRRPKTRRRRSPKKPRWTSRRRRCRRTRQPRSRRSLRNE
jgi:hypothetical protein